MVGRSQVFRKSMQAPGEMGKSEGEGKERSSGSRGLPYPLPIVCKALQISSQPLACFFLTTLLILLDGEGRRIQ